MGLISERRWICWRGHAAGVVVCLGISLSAYLAVLRPLLRQREAFAQQQQSLSDRRQKASQLAAVDSAHKKHLAVVRKSLAESKMVLQPAARLNHQIASLTKLVNDCGLTVDDIQVGKIRRGGRYDIVPIDLAGHGDYRSCVVFLRRLSQAFPDTGAASFEVSADPQKPAEGGEFHFGLFWYAAPQLKDLQK